MAKLKLETVKKLLRQHDMTISKSAIHGENEYRVNFKGGHEDSAYYTTDLDDAYRTALQMRKLHLEARRRYNPKKRKSKKFHKPKLTRINTSIGPLYVEDDGHVFARKDGIGYVGRVKTKAGVKKLAKNPTRVTKKAKKEAHKLQLRYGVPRAKKVAGGMIGTAKTKKQKEHFTRVRKAMNPKRRKTYPIVKTVWSRKSLTSPWKVACRVAGSVPDDVKKKCGEVAGKLAQKGWYVKYET